MTIRPSVASTREAHAPVVERPVGNRDAVG